MDNQPVAGRGRVLYDTFVVLQRDECGVEL